MKSFFLNRRTRLVLPAIALVAVLAACGGGGDDFVAGSDVPKDATRRNSDLISFMLDLQTRTNETSEPISLGAAVLASDETSEPATLSN